jgi:hypothetical protein
MPESFSALFKMVSFTAAKTRRMLDVSVACVKLENGQQEALSRSGRHILGVQVQMGSVDLVESPEEVLGGLVDVVATRVIGEVVAKW